MSLNTRRKPLSNNTDFNTGKTFNTATSKNNPDSRNIELVGKRTKSTESNEIELPSSSNNNVPKNGVNFIKNNRSDSCSNLEDTEKKKINPSISGKKNRKGKKTTEIKMTGENTFLGDVDPSTTHEKECFVNHNEPKRNSVVVGPPRKGIRPVERERMRDWLCRHLNAKSIRGLYWLEKTKMIFRIPWKHGSSQNWTEADAELFVEWAKHTGRYYPDSDRDKGKLNTKRFKATFRCALNSLPDCQELINLNNKAGVNAFKVYQFSCDKDSCPYKKKKASKANTTACDKSVECHDGETCLQAGKSCTSADEQISKECDPEPMSDTCTNGEVAPSAPKTPPRLIQEQSCPAVTPEPPVSYTPRQKTPSPIPCRSNSSFDDMSISENDVANTLLELQRGTVSRLIKEKERSQIQPPTPTPPPPPPPPPPQSHMIPVTHILHSQMPVPPQTHAQTYSQPMLAPHIAKPVLQSPMQSVQVLQSQLTTHREIHPMTQSITYEQTSTMTVAHPVSSTVSSCLPYVSAVVLPYAPQTPHSKPQMAKVCMIPAIVSSTAPQMMNLHSNTFDCSTPQLVPVATSRLSSAPYNTHATLTETPVFAIKQEVVDNDYSQGEINNNNASTANNNNTNNNNNIAVKLENVETGDVTPNYRVSEPEPKKENRSSTVVNRNGFQPNGQAVSRKRTKEKKPISGNVHGAITCVPITGSAQNYLKKRKK